MVTVIVPLTSAPSAALKVNMLFALKPVPCHHLPVARLRMARLTLATPEPKAVSVAVPERALLAVKVTG